MRDEQAKHEEFEALVGGPNRGFRLMRHYQETSNPVSVYPRTPAEQQNARLRAFRTRAKADGYTEEQINAFLELQ